MAGSDAPIGRIGVNLPVPGVLDGCHAIGVEDAGKLLYGRELAAMATGFHILPHKDMHEARRPLRFLPNFIAQSTGLIGPDMADKFMDRREALRLRRGTNLVPREFMILSRVALNVTDYSLQLSGFCDAA